MMFLFVFYCINNSLYKKITVINSNNKYNFEIATTTKSKNKNDTKKIKQPPPQQSLETIRKSWEDGEKVVKEDKKKKEVVSG